MTDLEIYSAYLPYEVSVTNGNETVKMTVNNIDHCIITKDSFKLILRPLSDLENDKEFNSKYFISNDRTEGFKIKRKNETYTRLNELNYLFKNHFDVFGLIEQEKAININTL